MTRKILTIFTVLIVVAGISFLTYHFCCYSLLGKRFTHHPPTFKELGLTKEQSEKIDSLSKSISEQLAGLRKTLAAERIKLANLLAEEKTNQKEINRSIEKISSLLKEQQEKTVSHTLKIKEILTPEQKKKFISSLTKYFCEGCRGEIGSEECICGKCEK
jgi:Spy/CpxP family protein refolding chaperone